MGEKVWVRIKV